MTILQGAVVLGGIIFQGCIVLEPVLPCYRLGPKAGYFIYFKITPVFFNSVNEINRLRKEINMLLRKGMFLIHLKKYLG